MPLILILVLLLIVSSCATQRTKYGKYSKKEGGYQEKVVEESIRAVNFKANSNTKTSVAERFAQFRAIEICLFENFKLTHVLDVFDKTQSKTVTRTTSNGYPSYYYGMSPFYDRYSGMGFGFNMMNYSSWNETLKYPDVDVIFECANEVYEPELEFREVPADEMKHLVKDLRGGLQVEKIPATALSKNFKAGDIIVYAEGERVQQIYQLLKLFHKSKDRAITVELLRDGKTKQGFILKGIDASEKILAAQNAVIKKVCKSKELKKQHALCK